MDIEKELKYLLDEKAHKPKIYSFDNVRELLAAREKEILNMVNEELKGVLHYDSLEDLKKPKGEKNETVPQKGF